MLNSTFSILTTKVYNKVWLKLVVICAIIMVAIILYKRNSSPLKEGFSQKDRFISKYNGNVYDMFFAQIYDELNVPKKRISYEIDSIIKMTQSSDSSRFLDVGSGTGDIVNELNELGYDAYGVDNSEAMIEYSKTKFPNVMIKSGDAMNTMLYDHAVFSHILCLHYTIYNIK